MNCLRCSGLGIINNPPQICDNCKGTGIEWRMKNMDELIPFSAPVKVRRETEYSSILDQMKQNCVEGKETITFSKEDWANVLSVVQQVEVQIDNMSKMTPVAGPHGLCKATVCQWNALSTMRDKASKDADKLKKLYRVVEEVLQLVDRLVDEKILAMNGWWVEQAGIIRAKVDDMKRL